MMRPSNISDTFFRQEERIKTGMTKADVEKGSTDIETRESSPPPGRGRHAETERIDEGTRYKSSCSDMTESGLIYRIVEVLNAQLR
jgi:hypothetical protein